MFIILQRLPRLFCIGLIPAMFFVPLKSYSQLLYINEIMSSNSTTIQDEDGDYEDWIELYNCSDASINLLGYFLTDDASQPFQWEFPDIKIASDGFLLIFASGKDRTEGPFLHTNFSIKISGEIVTLRDSEGNIIDHFDPVELTTDNSYGRKPDGSGKLVFFSGSTPGFTNNQQPLLKAYPDTLFYSHSQGFYEDSFYLKIEQVEKNAQIRYTLNGSEPTLESLLFEDSLLIYNRVVDSNCISLIPTNPETAPESFRWRPPIETVFKGTVITARSFIKGQPASEIYRNSFFIDPDIFSKYGLPVISILTDSLNLFDYETGIYIPGYHHDQNPGWGWYYGTGNYHQKGEEWEREANIAFFEPDGQLAFQQDLGIRIHGSGTRAYAEKSLRLYARNRYGKNTIDYSFFPEKQANVFRRVILRNSGQDFLTTMLTDALSHRLVEHLDLETISSRPSIVFMNGEFWGIHNIRDRNDKYYLEYCCGADPEQIDLLEYGGSIIEGSNQDYHAMIAYITDHDLTDDGHYQIVENQMDIDNYIDYVIVKQYIAVYDWPGNNIEFWRPQTNGAKWRWILFDNDNALNNWDFNSIEHSTLEDGPVWPNPDWSTRLFRNLLKNEHFRQKYLDRFEYHLFNTFQEDHINQHLDSLLALIDPVIEDHIHRWQFPASFPTWNYYIKRIRKFAENRPCIMVEHLVEFFDITDTTFAYGICNPSPSGKSNSHGQEAEIKLFPNPASDYVFVDLKFENEGRKIMINLHDLLGREITSFETASNTGNRPLKLLLGDVMCGTYILTIHTEKDTHALKLIIR